MLGIRGSEQHLSSIPEDQVQAGVLVDSQDQNAQESLAPAGLGLAGDQPDAQGTALGEDIIQSVQVLTIGRGQGQHLAEIGVGLLRAGEAPGLQTEDRGLFHIDILLRARAG